MSAVQCRPTISYSFIDKDTMKMTMKFSSRQSASPTDVMMLLRQHGVDPNFVLGLYRSSPVDQSIFVTLSSQEVVDKLRLRESNFRGQGCNNPRERPDKNGMRIVNCAGGQGRGWWLAGVYIADQKKYIFSSKRTDFYCEIEVSCVMNIPTYNRFSPLATSTNMPARKRKKRADSDTSAGSPHPQVAAGSAVFQPIGKSEYKNIDFDGKMNCLFDMLSKAAPYFGQIDSLNQNLYHQKAIYDVTEARLRLLEYKTLDMETRMLRTNLVLSGLPEDPGSDDCIPTVERFLRDSLQLDPADIGIVRAQRIGRRRVNRGRTSPRAILVTFADLRHVNTIMQNVSLLRNTHYGVSRDYPREIREARKALWGDFKAARAEHGVRNVKLAFLAALIIHGETVSDAFPGWHKILQESRNSNVQARTDLRYKSIVEAVKATGPHPATEIAEESDESDSSEDMGPVQEKGRQQSSPTSVQPAKTLTEPGYLLHKHPVMTSVQGKQGAAGDTSEQQSPARDPTPPADPPSTSAAAAAEKPT